MVKTRGPLQSQEAAGKLAKALIFTTTKRGTNVKLYAKPRQPRTSAQVPIRAMISFLSQAWKTLTPAEQATWHPDAELRQTTAYHAYMKHNNLRWANYRGPSKVYPAAEVTTPLTSNWFRAYGGYRYAWTESHNHPPEINWGHIIHRGLIFHFVPTYQTIIGVQIRSTGDSTIYKDTPLEPGTYYYRSQQFTPDGLIADATYDWTVQVT